MKKSELAFNFIRVPVDYVMLVAAGLAAYFLRFSNFITDLRNVSYEIPFHSYIWILLLTALVWIIIFAVSGLYTFKGTRGIVAQTRSIFLACSTGVLVVILVIFFRRELFSSRFIIIIAWVISIVFVTVGRYIILKIQRYFFQKGVGAHRVVIIGATRAATTIRKEIEKNVSLGYRVVHHFTTADEAMLEQIKKFQTEKTIDEIFQTDPSLNQKYENQLLDFCQVKHITYKYVPNIHETRSINVQMDSLAGVPILELIGTPLDGWGRIAKRALDIIGAGLLIILTSPLMLLATGMIRRQDKGPIIYRNGRVGYKGKVFEAYKFRSYKPEFCTDWRKEVAGQESAAEKFEKELITKQNAKGNGPLYKIKDDPRVTKAGYFLRRSSIDELPQFFNVLRGEMSLVGPRPHQPKEVAQYKNNHMKLLSIKPGITGLAQISGRSDLEFGDEAKLDIYYIENWSLLWDIVILLKTPFALVKKRNTL
ncbi:MAG: hypothetical protein A3F54_04695 [Candidatus Kerfeldbacteria bacterium RIFCSPHIGHO2_12_FULL_48_17]|uniref:Bacterial sugar transferase domain-containing protein n=1 Tax=Candidatus Kerfeldbacteria bacterium RIFCSPHIGHO2_12_FULL_48_17 TaxID=1798542 RepID=A0A1G2B0W2_9BACT|nr:MAG: hypothetical protein A3F54_04695 [Candidatus Kerfeldbacteria bacterium RIFCSPHIGHO2_12_FULL_48_17]